MTIIFTNQFDGVNLVPPEGALTFTIEDDAGQYTRGSYITISQLSGLSNQPGGNLPESDVITDFPGDCVIYVNDKMIMTGMIVYKLFVFTPGSYICYCIVEDHFKRKVLLQSIINDQTDPTFAPVAHPLLGSNPTRQDKPNPISGIVPIVLPGVPVTFEISVQTSVLNDNGGL